MRGRLLVHVVPHTHWDREWYLPFQTFRMRLVDLVDGLLELMEADPRFAFTLDGQLGVVDDYLEIRPEAEPRLRRLVEEGRLAIGPWQILMDEFLVSGETIVRNLEAGLRRSGELGGAMPVGYLPDMFGHVAQMPQILRQARFTQAVVWRGVPAAIDRHAFLWAGPDGSEVRAEYLVGGYGNAVNLFEEANGLAARIEAFHETVRPFFDESAPLAMVGNDHVAPSSRLVDLVEELNAGQDRYLLRIETLAQYLAGADEEQGDFPRWRGELRSGARANMLMGVTSARLDLKAACARAERLLERYAEPLQALYGASWPEEYLRLAWRRVILSSAHDSICGCSVDAVCDEVLVRLSEAQQIAGDLARRAAATVAARVPAGSVAVLNPSPEPRSGLVELDVPIPDEWGEVALVLPDESRLAVQKAPRGTLLATVPAPPLGWVAISPVPGRGSIENPVETTPNTLRNGLLEVAVAPDGTLRVTGRGAALEGVGRLVDGGDFGDSYNYAPPETDAIVGEPESVAVERLSAGPVRGELAVVRMYRWPLGLEPGGAGRSSETVAVPVTMSVELHAGEQFVRFRVAFENPSSDHRLRFHIPLAFATASSFAEGQFAVVERNVDAEGGHGEVPLPTFPARGFVDAGGAAILLDHVIEYELLGGRELALTLLRSIGLISRTSNTYREEPAGPEIAIPAAQCRRPWSVGFGLHPHAGTWVEAGVLAQMERYQHPFLTAAGISSTKGELTGSGFEVEAEGVVLSSLRRRGEWLELRLVCQQPERRAAVVHGGFRKARATDLLGRPGEELALRGGSLELELEAWEIRTVQLRR